MAFLPRHRSRILNRVPVSKSTLRNGTIIEFRYQKKDGTGGLYMAIVLSVWPPAGGITQKKVHALSLDEVSDNRLMRFVKQIGRPSLDEDVRTKTEQEISKFILPKGRSAPKRFYKIKLDKIPGMTAGAYRTFNLKNMSQIRLIDYDFENVVPERFMGQISED